MNKNKPANDEQAKTAKSKQKMEQTDLQQQPVTATSRQIPITAPPDSGGSGVLSRQTSSIMRPQTSSVMSRQPSSVLSRQPSALLQRSSSESEGELDGGYPQIKIGGRNFAQFVGQTSSLPRIQPKLMTGPLNDKYAQKADRVTKQAVGTPTPIQRQSEGTTHQIIQRKEGEVITGVIAYNGPTGKNRIKTTQMMPWYDIPEGADLALNTTVKFKEGANRAVTELEVLNEGGAESDFDKMSTQKILETYYPLFEVSTALAKEKYKCRNFGEDGVNRYSREYHFNGVDKVIVHIHWEKIRQKIFVSKAHIKKSEDKYVTGKSCDLGLPDLKQLGIPTTDGESLDSKPQKRQNQNRQNRNGRW